MHSPTQGVQSYLNLFRIFSYYDVYRDFQTSPCKLVEYLCVVAKENTCTQNRNLFRSPKARFYVSSFLPQNLLVALMVLWKIVLWRGET